MCWSLAKRSSCWLWFCPEGQVRSVQFFERKVEASLAQFLLVCWLQIGERVHVLLIGIIAGLRAFAAPTAVSWAARLGYLPLAGTHLSWLGSIVTAGILTALALF